MRLSYRQLRLSSHPGHGAGVAVTGGSVTNWQRHPRMPPWQTAAAYAEHFEAQIDRGPARTLLSAVLRIFRRPGVLLAVILVTCGLLGYAAATVHLAPVVPAGAGQLTAPPGPPGAAAADRSLRMASLRDATIIRMNPATG